MFVLFSVHILCDCHGTGQKRVTISLWIVSYCSLICNLSIPGLIIKRTRV